MFTKDLNFIELSLSLSDSDLAKIFNVDIKGYRNLSNGTLAPSNTQESKAKSIRNCILEADVKDRIDGKYIERSLNGNQPILMQLQEPYLNVTLLRSSLAEAKRVKSNNDNRIKMLMRKNDPLQ